MTSQHFMTWLVTNLILWYLSVQRDEKNKIINLQTTCIAFYKILFRIRLAFIKQQCIITRNLNLKRAINFLSSAFMYLFKYIGCPTPVDSITENISFYTWKILYVYLKVILIIDRISGTMWNGMWFFVQ